MKLMIPVLWGALATAAPLAGHAAEEAPSSYPMYGNWCGPKHPLDTSNAPPPIDDLDASCMRHDLCYEKQGDLNCECDAALVGEIRAGLDMKIYSGNPRIYARTIHNYFQGSPCNGDPSRKLAPSRALHRIYQKAKQKVESAAEFIGVGEAKADTAVATEPNGEGVAPKAPATDAAEPAAPPAQ